MIFYPKTYRILPLILLLTSGLVMLSFNWDERSSGISYFNKSILTKGVPEWIQPDYDPGWVFYDSTFLVRDPNSGAQFYYQHLYSPVCTDTLCKPVQIYLVFNLAGNYIDYRLDAKHPLTKVDHDPFQTADYKKLHYILYEENSILGQYSKENIENLVKPPSETGTDAISGATPATIKESIVEGALYTCHTLWKHAHGELGPALKEHTETELLDEDLIRHMLQTGDTRLINFSLEHLHRYETSAFRTEFVKLIRSSYSYTANRLIEGIPGELINDPGFIEELWMGFEELHYSSRGFILERMVANTRLSSQTLNKMIVYGNTCSDEHFLQIKKVLSVQSDLTRKQEKSIRKLTDARK